MDNLLTTVGTIAGIGGIALGVSLILFREIIRKQIFPTLTKRQAYKLIILISFLVWSLSIIGIIAWLINTDNNGKKITPETYNVSIRNYPTSVNFAAKIQPHSLTVELHCGKNVQRLKNLNYPISKTFTWSPSECGDVIIYISVGNTTLKKVFSGPFGFPEFLRVFADGYRIYRPNEFNTIEFKALKDYGIEFLNVHFQFGGDTKQIMQYLSY